MKPTQEQVEAARFFLYDWQMSGETVDDLAIRIAARDAERDAKWEKRDRIAIKALTWYAVQMKGRWNGAMDMDLLAEEARLALVALGAWPIDAALSNLGAEEKPKHNHDGYCERCAKDDAKRETEYQSSASNLREDPLIFPGLPNPEPKCGECHGREFGDLKPCPECGQRNDPAHHTRLKGEPKREVK